MQILKSFYRGVYFWQGVFLFFVFGALVARRTVETDSILLIAFLENAPVFFLGLSSWVAASPLQVPQRTWLKGLSATLVLFGVAGFAATIDSKVKILEVNNGLKNLCYGVYRREVGSAFDGHGQGAALSPSDVRVQLLKLDDRLKACLTPPSVRK